MNSNRTAAEENIMHAVRMGIDEGVAEMYAGPVLKRGVATTRDFKKNDFVLEYAGVYVRTLNELNHRLKQHEKNGLVGSYVFGFKHHEHCRW